MRKVWRDITGKVVNIGEWETMEETDENGVTLIHNPIPENLTVAFEETVIGYDEGIYASDDSRKDGPQ